MSFTEHGDSELLHNEVWDIAFLFGDEVLYTVLRTNILKKVVLRSCKMQSKMPFFTTKLNHTHTHWHIMKKNQKQKSFYPLFIAFSSLFDRTSSHQRVFVSCCVLLLRLSKFYLMGDLGSHQNTGLTILKSSLYPNAPQYYARRIESLLALLLVANLTPTHPPSMIKMRIVVS